MRLKSKTNFYLSGQPESCVPERGASSELLLTVVGYLPAAQSLLPGVSDGRFCHSGRLRTPPDALVGTSDGVAGLSEALRGLSDVRRAASDGLRGTSDD